MRILCCLSDQIINWVSFCLFLHSFTFYLGAGGNEVFSFSVPVPPFLEPSYQPLHNAPGAKRCLSDEFSASVCVHINICIG